MSITKTEDNLIRLLVGLDMEEETILTVTDFLKTDELRERMINFLIKRHEQKGEVPEQDVLKAVIMLTAKKKTEK